MKKNMKNVLMTIIGAVALGVIVNITWSLLCIPLGSLIQKVIFKIITFGLTSLSDDVYSNVAKGLHEKSSIIILQIVWTVIAVLLGGYIGMVLGHYLSKRISTKLDETGKSEEREKLLRKLQRSKERSDIFLLFWFVWFFSICSIDIYKEIYINQRITGFRQAFTICKPYLSDKEEEEILSEFSMIKNKNDYDILVKKLVETTEQKYQNKK